MELRRGYKQTEIGPIPRDWMLVPLGSCLRRPASYGINAAAVPFDTRFPTYLRITDITEDGRFSRATRASVAHSAAASYLLNAGDEVFARTGASVGKSYLYDSRDGVLVFAGFLIRLSPSPDLLAPAFLSHYAQRRPYWNWVHVNSMRSGQPGINGSEYASLSVPLPPAMAEQEAIAGVLSDADALIESLDQLLAKKRHLKQGAMQELLTGKKRLPGFNTKWSPERLDALGRWTGGMTPSMANPAYWQGGAIPWISSGDVKSVRLSTTAFAITEYAAKQTGHNIDSGELDSSGPLALTRKGPLVLTKNGPASSRGARHGMARASRIVLPDPFCLLPFGAIARDGDHLRLFRARRMVVVSGGPFSLANLALFSIAPGFWSHEAGSSESTSRSP